MKKIFLITLSVFQFLNIFSQAIIKGVIHNGPLQVALLEPIMGFSQQVIAKPSFAIKLDDAGFFEKKIHLSKPSTLILKIGFEPIYLFVEPNDTINVEIDISKFTKSSLTEGLILQGKNAQGNLFFNQYNYNPGNKFLPFKKLLDSANFYTTLDWTAVDEALNRAKTPFAIMLKEKKITTVFYNAVTKGISGILLTSITSKLLAENSITSIIKPLDIVSQMYKKYPVNIEDVKKTNFGHLIAFHYYKFLQSKNTLSYLSNDTTMYLNTKNYIIRNDFSYWLFAPKPIQEFLWALHLLKLKRLFPQSITISDVKTYLILHPFSRMKPYLQPPYFADDFRPTGGKDFSKILIIKDSLDTTLSSVIENHFKGKRVLVDFWATWCSPCKGEFVYNKFVDSLLVKYNIERLYISIDLPHFEKELLNNIYRYNLQGNHIHANLILQNSIADKFSSEGQFSIPRYMLVNEDGKIINDDVVRPSQKNNFINDIKTGFRVIN